MKIRECLVFIVSALPIFQTKSKEWLSKAYNKWILTSNIYAYSWIMNLAYWLTTTKKQWQFWAQDSKKNHRLIVNSRKISNSAIELLENALLEMFWLKIYLNSMLGTNKICPATGRYISQLYYWFQGACFK